MRREEQERLNLDVVVIATSQEEQSRRDRHSLKQMHAGSVLHFSSGSECIDFLGQHHVDLVLVDSSLTDMDGLKFVKLVRMNMNLKDTPLVMITAEGKRNRVLEAIAAGVDGYVLRPYSQETFQGHIMRAMKLERVLEIEESQLLEGKQLLSMGKYEEAIEAFEELVAEDNLAQKYYDLGCKYLVRQKFGQAIIAFKKAVKLNDLYAEAYKGLAEAYKARGDLENYKAYLQRAAETFAHFDRMEETKELFIEILKYDNDAPNPFNTLGVRLRKAGDVPGALHAYIQALELTPEDENIYYNMAKAQFYTGDVRNAKDSIQKSLRLNPGFEEARKLHLKLFNREFELPRSAGRPKPTVEAGSLESLKDV